MLQLLKLINPQRAIQQGKIKFDAPRKMKVDDNPFPRDQNMVDAKLLKGKTKVLTSTRAKENWNS